MEAEQSSSADVASVKETLSVAELVRQILDIASLGEAGCSESQEMNTTGSKEDEKLLAENEEPDDQEGSARVLENDVILRRIFKNLPTWFLLSSCSLVNKFWNTKARSFIWTYRKCTLRQRWDISTCQFLQEVDALCSQMSANGRKIPFNGLKLASFSQSSSNCSQEAHEAGPAVAGHVGKELEIKYLEAFQGSEESDCSVHHPLCNLLSKDGRSRLRSLQIENVRFFGDILSRGGLDHQFATLEKFSLGDGESLRASDSDDHSACKEIVVRLLRLAPNLKEIFAPNVSVLAIVPEEKFKLLKKLNFRLNRTEHIELLQKIAVHSSGVEELDIYEPPTASQIEAHDYLVNDEPVDQNLRRRFENALGRLVQTCHKSLRTISIVGTYSLDQISHNPLVNLRTLFVYKRYDGTPSQIWKAISSTDYARISANLHEMQIIINTLTWSEDEYCFDSGPDTYIDWPEHEDSGAVTHCSSVRKLTLGANVARINLYMIKSLLPNISHLVIRISQTWVTYNELPPVFPIWELWPHLEELVITGDYNYLQRSYDADFCGINKEEVELLMDKDNEFLQAVHIVPIRPCIWTMTSLRRVHIDLKFTGAFLRHGTGERLSFASKVTQLVALKRMSHQNISISGGIMRGFAQ